MVAHRQLPPPHWLPQAPCTPASICAPVAARLTHNGLRGIPLHASRFLRQRCEQLGQAAARGAGCCDLPASTEAEELTTHAERYPWSGRRLPRECDSAWQGAAVRALELLAGMGFAALVTASTAFASGNPLLPALPAHERRAGIEQASATEDRLLTVLKQVEAKVGSALGAFSDVRPVQGEEAAAREAAEARELVEEVRAVVAENYLDARGSGWDPAAWDAACRRVLAGPLRDTAAAHRAIRELLASGLDPFTRFITPEDFLAMRKYDVTGVGLNLAPAEEYERKVGAPLPSGSPAEGGVWVIGMIRGTAAERAGVEQGDQLLAVDGRALDGASPFQAANLLMGAVEEGPTAAPPTAVTVTVRHYNGETAEISIPRPKRTLESPVAVSLEERERGKVGTIRLAAFNSRAVPDVAAAVRRLEGAGAAELVLDLRDNRGGLVQEGVELARLFLDGGSTVVVTAGRGIGEVAVRATGAPLTRAPLTLLVNEWSASASEIFAGALRDNCRAVLVGSRTYGKGLIQSVYELSDSSGLVLTVGKYLTPARTDIDREGIQPDFRHPPPPYAAAERLAACRMPARA